MRYEHRRGCPKTLGKNFTKFSLCSKTKEGAIFAQQLEHKICGQGLSICSREGC